MLQIALSPVLNALHERDAERLASFFTDDATLTSEHLNVYSGSAVIREVLSRRFAEEANATVELRSDPKIRQVTDDVAIVEFEFQALDAPAAPDYGRSISVVRRTGDSWLIHSQWLIPLS